jgi:hypothetical protein
MAEHGNAAAQWRRGLWLLERTCGPQPSSEAVRFLRLSAEPTLRMVVEFQYALCLPIESSERKSYLKCAASQGHESG